MKDILKIVVTLGDRPIGTVPIPSAAYKKGFSVGYKAGFGAGGEDYEYTHGM